MWTFMKTSPRWKQWTYTSVTPKSYLVFPVLPPFCPSLSSTLLLCFLSLVISLHFLQFYVNGILLYALFLVWPLLLSVMVLKFIQVVVCVSILKFYCWLLFHCMHGPQCLGCFGVWAMTNKVAINNCIPVSVWTYVFRSLGYTYIWEWNCWVIW